MSLKNHIAGDKEYHDGHHEEAFRLWEKGANLGHRQCIKNLAWAYASGIGCEVDAKKARYWSEKDENWANWYSPNPAAKFLYLVQGCEKRKHFLEWIDKKDDNLIFFNYSDTPVGFKREFKLHQNSSIMTGRQTMREVARLFAHEYDYVVFVDDDAYFNKEEFERQVIEGCKAFTFPDYFRYFGKGTEELLDAGILLDECMFAVKSDRLDDLLFENPMADDNWWLAGCIFHGHLLTNFRDEIKVVSAYVENRHISGPDSYPRVEGFGEREQDILWNQYKFDKFLLPGQSGGAPAEPPPANAVVYMDDINRLTVDVALPPKIISFSTDNPYDINDVIFDIEKRHPVTSYSSHGHKGIYQSEHDLNESQEFEPIIIWIEGKMKEKVKSIFFDPSDPRNFKISRMWFVIASKGTKILPHIHPEGHISGILYLKIPSNIDTGKLSILNPQKNIVLYTEENPRGRTLRDDVIKISPYKNNMLLFTSNLMHSVDAYDENTERISLVWDAVYSL